MPCYFKNLNKQRKPIFMNLAFNAPDERLQSPQTYLEIYLERISLPDNELEITSFITKLV
ncbi:MAG: hypothetical protein ACI9DJ_002651 [Algoriphagus sp.]|jgi:hypothetical protein